MRLPAVLYSSIGEVPVVCKEEIVHPDPIQTAFGMFNALTRSVELSDKVESPVVRLATLMHEWVHVMLFDSGAQNLLTAEQEEVVCDAVANGLTGAIVHQYITLRRRPR